MNEHTVNRPPSPSSVTAQPQRDGTTWWSTVTVHSNRAAATATAVTSLCDQLGISTAAAATTTALLALRAESVL